MANKEFSEDPFQLQVALAIYRRNRDRCKTKLEKEYWNQQVQQTEELLQKALSPKEVPNAEEKRAD